MDVERWQRLMKRLGLPPALETYEELIRAYSEPHRHYHTAAHVETCLLELDRIPERVIAMDRVELALWFHDAVYRTTSSRNELDSAEWASRFLTRAGADDSMVGIVYDAILATRHAALPDAEPSKWVVDIDLAILGYPAKEYALFEENIRREYAWVPKRVFRKKRMSILRSFLDRPTIYLTAWFRSEYEEQARHNLAEALAKLRV